MYAYIFIYKYGVFQQLMLVYGIFIIIMMCHLSLNFFLLLFITFSSPYFLDSFLLCYRVPKIYCYLIKGACCIY